MRLEDYEATFIRVCFAAHPSASDIAALRTDADKIRLYRGMVRTRLMKACRSALPRSVDAAGAERFDAWLEAFFAQASPASRFFREVVSEFGAWLGGQAQCWQVVGPWFGALVQWELDRWQLRDVEGGPLEPALPFSFDLRPALAPSAMVRGYGWNVYRVSAEHSYTETDVQVLSFRNEQTFRVRARVVPRWLTPAWLAWIRGDATVTQAVTDAAEASGRSIDAALLEELSEHLAEVMSLGGIVGSHRAR